MNVAHVRSYTFIGANILTCHIHDIYVCRIRSRLVLSVNVDSGLHIRILGIQCSSNPLVKLNLGESNSTAFRLSDLGTIGIDIPISQVTHHRQMTLVFEGNETTLVSISNPLTVYTEPLKTLKMKLPPCPTLSSLYTVTAHVPLRTQDDLEWAWFTVSQTWDLCKHWFSSNFQCHFLKTTKEDHVDSELICILESGKNNVLLPWKSIWVPHASASHIIPFLNRNEARFYVLNMSEFVYQHFWKNIESTELQKYVMGEFMNQTHPNPHYFIGRYVDRIDTNVRMLVIRVLHDNYKLALEAFRPYNFIKIEVCNDFDTLEFGWCVDLFVSKTPIQIVPCVLTALLSTPMVWMTFDDHMSFTSDCKLDRSVSNAFRLQRL